MKLGEPVVTIRLTEAEIILINEMIDRHISFREKKEKISPAKYTLQKELLKIEKWIDDEKQKAINDKKQPDPKKEYIKKITGEKSSEKWIQKKDSKGLRISFAD